MPRSTSFDGRYGRMFRSLPPFAPTDATLKKLSEVNPANQGLVKLRADIEAARSSGKQAPPRPAGKGR